MNIGTTVLTPAQGAEAVVREAAFPTGPEVRLWRRYGEILAQLGLLLFVVAFFRIENEAFVRMAVLAVAGFAVHYLLPLRHRLPFFVALSLAGLVVVLGADHAAWVVGIGAALIGIAHLPVHVYARAGILLAVGLGLAIPRWGMGSVPWSPAIWPIVGSLFVFRLFSYLYDRHHGTQPTGMAQVLAYFFLLPNVCFPLFPIIDFKRFCRSYYDAERHNIYQVGVEWIWRGVIQLLIYRLVYFHLTIDPVAVENVADLTFYMLSTFFLYVRLSGYFHIVIGILHLFGFNLPETHHRYFLASSFTDFWRRINIYWKDFMMKVVFYPVFFRFRKLGDTKALIGATLLTFVVTWVLHMVQWFWIRGSVLVEWNDIIFWSLFATLVLVNSLYEAKHGRARTLAGRERSLPESIGIVMRTTATFVTICVMWSFWSAESATDWALMVSNAMSLPAWEPWQWSAGAAIIVLALVAWCVAVWKSWEGRADAAMSPTTAPATIAATSVLLCLAATPAVTTRIGLNGEVMDSLRLASTSALNRRDAEQFQRGYYENLVDVSKFNSELWSRYQQLPTDFVRSLSRLGLSRPTHDEQDYELVPLKEGRFVGALVSTNRWGMRDRDYSQTRPPGVYRMALLGPSTAMGSGVEVDESFEALLEQRFNHDLGESSANRYELLNFGVAGYSPLHMLYQLERKVLAFEPDMAIFLGHVSDKERTSRQLTQMIQDGIVPKDSYLADVARQTGIGPGTRTTEARRRMRPFEESLLEWVYRKFVSDSKAHDVVPVFVYMETVTEPTETWRAPDRALVLELARKSGFLVFDLTGAYNPYKPAELWIAENDGHPNALGNRLLADRLFSLMTAGSGNLPLVRSD